MTNFYLKFRYENSKEMMEYIKKYVTPNFWVKYTEDMVYGPGNKTALIFEIHADHLELFLHSILAAGKEWAYHSINSPLNK